MNTNHAYMCRLEIIIYRNGGVYREIIPLGEYDEEKHKSGFYDNLRFEYPEGFVTKQERRLGDDGIFIWPVIYKDKTAIDLKSKEQ